MSVKTGNPPTRVEGELLRRYLHLDQRQRAKELELLRRHLELGRVAIFNLTEEIRAVYKEKKRIAKAFKAMTQQEITDYIR